LEARLHGLTKLLLRWGRRRPALELRRLVLLVLLRLLLRPLLHHHCLLGRVAIGRLASLGKLGTRHLSARELIEQHNCWPGQDKRIN